MSYPERNLKIEYKRLKHEPNGNKSVGERRNFCFTEMGVPFGGITHNCCIIDAKLFSG